MNQVRERLGVETKLFLGDSGNQFGARFVIRLVKHARAGLLAELLGVSRCKKRALMMVEPPRHFRGVGKLEIHDDVFVAIEQACFPGLCGAVRHPGEAKLRAFVKAFAVEAVKKSSRSSAIKTTIVKAEPDLSHKCASSLLRLHIARQQGRRSQPRCTRADGLSRRNACRHLYRNLESFIATCW